MNKKSLRKGFIYLFILFILSQAIQLADFF